MSDANNYGDSTHELPEELCEAFAFYDEVVQNTGNRQQSRLVTLEKYPAWIDRLRQHFETEDRLLGVRTAGHQEMFDSSILADSNSRLVPRYRLGVGGQGEVWLAHDPELDRFVALKVIKETERGSQQTVARFWREAELTGKLEHPNIVPVYEANRGVGTEDARVSPYYVMRVYGNRHLLRAITALHARERQPDDSNLLLALQNFHQHRSVAHEQLLQQALRAFSFDDSQPCDRDLREAVDALRQDPGEQSGRSLQEAIQVYHGSERSTADFRELLNRFIDVCDAVAYAHSRGVIHRDLKPQNVMLGEFGETMVVDWGLAKVIGRSVRQGDTPSGGIVHFTTGDSAEAGSQTRVGTLIGTLSYMSPEQAWGRVDELEPATDIYSLGGILYAILTGKPPRSGASQSELKEVARKGHIISPSALQPDTPKPLEAICLKALSKSPSDRYPVAKDFAADVARWLADEPVSAWREPITVRAKRWVKNHQTLVGSTVAAVLVAVATLSVMMVVVNGQKNELADAYSDLNDRNTELKDKNVALDTANLELTAANEREGAARQLAQENEREAARQRDVAVQQSQLALSTLTSVIFDVQTGLANVPGGSEVRRRLLVTSMEKLEQVAVEYVGQAVVDYDTMVAMSQLGDVVLRFGLGTEDMEAPGDLHTGSPELMEEERSAVNLARLFYSEARHLAEGLLDEEPTNAEVRRELSVVLNKLANAYSRLGKTSAAIDFYQEALAIREGLKAESPNDTQALRDLSLSYGILGDLRLQSSRLLEARELYLKALAIDEEVVRQDRTNTLAQHDLAVSLGRLGDVCARLNQPDETTDYYLRAIDVFESLRDDDSIGMQVHRNYSLLLGRLGNMCLDRDQYSEALAFFERSLEIEMALAHDDLEDSLSLRTYSVSLSNLGDLCAELSRFEDALEYYRQCLEIQQRLADNDASDVDAQRDVVFIHYRMAMTYEALVDFDSSIAHLNSGIDVLERMIANDLHVMEMQNRLSILTEQLHEAEREAVRVKFVLAEWNTFISEPDHESLLSRRIALLARESRFDEIPQTAALLRALNLEDSSDTPFSRLFADVVGLQEPERQSNLYNAACGYALCANALQPAGSESPTADQQALQQEYIELALTCLRESIAAGWSDFEHMQQDPDLAVLRDLPEFQSLLPVPMVPEAEQQ